MPIYRKKPVEIEARRFDGENADKIINWITSEGGEATFMLEGTKNPKYHLRTIHIETLEGTMIARPRDYVIRGIEGEFYPCKPDIFEKTYEEVT